MSLGLASASKPPSGRVVRSPSDKIILSASGSNLLISGEAHPRPAASGQTEPLSVATGRSVNPTTGKFGFRLPRAKRRRLWSDFLHAIAPELPTNCIREVKRVSSGSEATWSMPPCALAPQRASYMCARPTLPSRKASCDARPVHTSRVKLRQLPAIQESLVPHPMWTLGILQRTDHEAATSTLATVQKS
jgi:hypothetical protein